jgi:hypothetical protein
MIRIPNGLPAVLAVVSLTVLACALPAQEPCGDALESRAVEVRDGILHGPDDKFLDALAPWYRGRAELHHEAFHEYVAEDFADEEEFVREFLEEYDPHGLLDVSASNELTAGRLSALLLGLYILWGDENAAPSREGRWHMVERRVYQTFRREGREERLSTRGEVVFRNIRNDTIHVFAEAQGSGWQVDSARYAIAGHEADVREDLIPAWEYIFEDQSEARWKVAREEMGQILHALSHYRLRNQEYPESLDAIAEQFPGDRVPHDPFTREPYLYERTERGFYLICYGANGTPDGDEPPNEPIAYSERGLLDSIDEVPRLPVTRAMREEAVLLASTVKRMLRVEYAKNGTKPERLRDADIDEQERMLALFKVEDAVHELPDEHGALVVVARHQRMFGCMLFIFDYSTGRHEVSWFNSRSDLTDALNKRKALDGE